MNDYEAGARAAYGGEDSTSYGARWNMARDEWFKGYFDAKRRMILDKLAKEFANALQS